MLSTNPNRLVRCHSAQTTKALVWPPLLSAEDLDQLDVVRSMLARPEAGELFAGASNECMGPMFAISHSPVHVQDSENRI